MSRFVSRPSAKITEPDATPLDRSATAPPALISVASPCADTARVPGCLRSRTASPSRQDIDLLVTYLPGYSAQYRRTRGPSRCPGQAVGPAGRSRHNPRRRESHSPVPASSRRGRHSMEHDPRAWLWPRAPRWRHCWPSSAAHHLQTSCPLYSRFGNMPPANIRHFTEDRPSRVASIPARTREPAACRSIDYRPSK